MNPKHTLGILAALMVFLGGGPTSILLWVVTMGWLLTKLDV